MSDLQLALFGLGAAVMASVFAYNRYQERRFMARRAQTQQVVSEGGAPAATAGAADVPRGAASAADDEGDVATVPPADIPVIHHLGRGVEEEAMPDLAGPAGPRILDHRLDYIATLNFVATHRGEEVLRRSGEIVRVSKRIEWEGFSEGAASWEGIAPATAYRQVRAGLQLIDRRGVANEAELLAFCQGLQALAVTLVAEIDFPSRADALKSAGEFDRQLADLDIQVGLNVVKLSGPAIAGQLLQQAAETAGAELQSDGRFYRLDGDGAEVFTLVNLEPHPFRSTEMPAMTTRGVTVAMDVPRAPDSAEAFSQFVGFARELARTLDAELVDDNRRPISAGSLAAIDAEVMRVRSRLAELGLNTGSELALRVFA
jgi:hypothetical protein